MKTTGTYSYHIGAQDIDFRKQASLPSLTTIILTTAGRNADENGFGLLHLLEQNYTWVLLRLTVEMKRIPHENDEISVETWIDSVGTAFTNRNFVFTDQSGEIIGYAASSWAIIHMETRQSVLLDTLTRLSDFIVPKSIPIATPARIPNVKGDVANTFRVQYSDLDINRHANSLHYIEWISDCFSLDFYLSHTLKHFEINFLRELTFGDEGEVHCQMKEDGDYYFQLVAQRQGIACRARLLFEPQ
ncbi:MAG TPA: hypothetical protein DDZ96_04480 [Porphyromonadaceae bacterium]|jgi:acyl-ACP thioesterase|nr:hypothetical protein [Porphyromonadaceae bacterium]HBX20264.1 hypothetical protein [Porphyromonadaceae bacterium]HCM19647.1 hypothetical protein [Porphyromonadaceae bacterium]